MLATRQATDELADYEAKIAALKAQIAEKEAQAAALQQQSYEEYDEEEYIIEEYYDEEILEEEIVEGEEYVEEEAEGDYIEIEEPLGHVETSATVHAYAETNPSARNYVATRQDQLDALKEKEAWSKPAFAQPRDDVQRYGHASTPAHTHLVDKQRALQKKHQFAKPAWASRNIADDICEGERAGIDKESIANPLLKQNHANGYSRQVFAKETLHRSNGTYVAPRQAVPPRLAWIVININQKKVGKIVLHLYGAGVDEVVYRFEDMVGMSIERQGNHKPIFVEELSDPAFYITTNQTTKNLHEKRDVYGVVQEGKEIIRTIKSADEHAAITIRQAHVYPVKKTKA